LGKTAFAGTANASGRERARVPGLPAKAPSRPPSPLLPSAEEARQNPDLIIKLDKAARSDSSAGSPPENHAAPRASESVAVDLPPGPKRDDIAVDLPPPPSPSETKHNAIPPPGTGKRFDLPQPHDSTSAGPGNEPAAFSDRLVADTRSIIELLNWAFTAYLRQPKPLLLLAALLVFPASLLESCLVAGITGGAPDEVRVAGTTTVDFTARKAELAARIQNSQMQGQFDKQAAAELAALTVETSSAPAAIVVHRGEDWLREKLANLIQGLLLFGLAFPIACGALSIATIDRLGGAALPSFGDIWPILVARSELFLLSLIPAALLVAVGNALFVLPGLVLSVLFLFLPQVVLFEKRSGRSALLRSIDLVKSDAIRVVLAFLSFALAGFASATLTELFIPPAGGRAIVFVHFVIGDLLAVAVLPIPAMVLARLYLDLRGRKGLTAEQLSRAARS
jgi:hypothetical protein